MKTGNIEPVIETYRKLVQTYIDLHVYESALFWADKVVALTGNTKDIYRLAQCMYLLKQYHRATHLLRSRNLDKANILCNYLTVRCLLEANELAEALKIIESFDLESFSRNNGHVFDDTPKNKIYSSVLLLKAKVLEGMDNRGLATECYKQALQKDVYCFEAFDSLIKYHMLTATEEQELINLLPFTEQCTHEESELLQLLYLNKLKKYHTPLNSKFYERSLPRTTSENTEVGETPVLLKLYNSLDFHVFEAEILYYNCDYQQCNNLTESILKQDPYHTTCLPIHISCQVELKQSNKLFSLAHNLIDLYPNMAISWFSVGCYYYIINKSDYARRYLAKATCLDRLFGPAWLAYGHSFAIENEHDQAMAAYFKASQLMKGCHLPLLYIGLECGLTNNVKLAEKFFKQAQNIAPFDPFVLHEMGVIAFQNLNYKAADKYFRDALLRVKRVKGDVIPQRWEALLNNLGHTSRKLKKFEEALDFHHQALLLSPQSANTYSSIAYNHALMGHTEESVDWFHKALGLRNDDSFCTTMLNYVIEQLTEEKPPYPDAPEGIPKFDIKNKTIDTTNSDIITEDTQHCASNELTDMSMSIEIEMTDASGTVKE